MKHTLAIAAVLAGLAVAPSANSENGVTDDVILLGQSCALKGPAAALGTGMNAGLQVYFDKVNAAGGVDGRKIELKAVNDGYEPEKCQQAVNMLIDKAGVFAIIGEVGTPTSKVAEPICVEKKVPFIAPFTGAEFLRNPYERYVVNLRGSYFQEMEALAGNLCDQRGFTKVACFYQNDSYGQAGLTGIRNALERRGLSLVAEGTYERNTVAVNEGFQSIADSGAEAVVMVGAYKACGAFIKLASEHSALKNAVCCNISFVGTDALVAECGAAGKGSIISQVVPYPYDESVPVVKEYLADMKAAGKASDIGFVSLEGYLAAKLFCTAVGKVSGELTRETFLDAVASTGTFDLGGFVLQYGPSDNQGSDNVWLTWSDGGKAIPLDGTSVAGVDD